MNKDKLELLLMLAFEYGRNFEQLYLDLDLYNSINFNDLLYAKEKGADFKNIDISNFENVSKTKITTDIEKRKLEKMFELKKKAKELINLFK